MPKPSSDADCSSTLNWAALETAVICNSELLDVRDHPGLREALRYLHVTSRPSYFAAAGSPVVDVAACVSTTHWP